MTIVLQQTMPEGVTIEMLDEVTVEMGVEKDPPKGLLLHVHFVENGRTRIIDVWESAEAFETFQRDQLMPAIEKVMQRLGIPMDGAPQPETSITEVATVVRGS